MLWGSAVRGHRSKIMLGVLVVVLRPDRIAGQSLRLGQREIPLIVSLRVLASMRVLRAPRFGTGGVLSPSLGAGGKRPCRSGLAHVHYWFWAICMAPSLVVTIEVVTIEICSMSIGTKRIRAGRAFGLGGIQTWRHIVRPCSWRTRSIRGGENRPRETIAISGAGPRVATVPCRLRGIRESIIYDLAIAVGNVKDAYAIDSPVTRITRHFGPLSEAISGMPP